MSPPALTSELGRDATVWESCPTDQARLSINPSEPGQFLAADALFWVNSFERLGSQRAGTRLVAASFQLSVETIPLAGMSNQSSIAVEETNEAGFCIGQVVDLPRDAVSR